METTFKETVDKLLGTAAEVMRPQVVTLDADASLGEAARRLEDAGISGAPVMEDHRIVGMVSLKDLFEAAGVAPELARTSGPWHRYEHIMSHSAKRTADAMSRQVVTVSPDTSVAEVAEIMRTRGVNRVPVVDADGRVLGIVARDDVIDAVARVMQRVRATGS